MKEPRSKKIETEKSEDTKITKGSTRSILQSAGQHAISGQRSADSKSKTTTATKKNVTHSAKKSEDLSAEDQARWRQAVREAEKDYARGQRMIDSAEKEAEAERKKQKGPRR